MKRNEIVAAGVAGAAFIGSAQHIWEVTHDAGNHPLVAALHPLALDGLIYIGISAMGAGRKRSGAFTIAVGAGYSLAFNAASYGGFTMPAWALAACLPVAMMLSFLMVHAKKAVEEIQERVVEVEKIVEVPVEVIKYVEIPTPTTPRPRRRVLPDAPVSGARAAAWDVEAVVDAIVTGTDVDMDKVSVKNLQRTKRIVRLITEGGTDEDVAATVKLSAAHVARVRAAMEAKEEAK